MLALKLLLVPCFLLLVTLAGRRWGAAMAGWLAGLPVVTGPILYFLAREQGGAFVAGAASAALAAVLASVAFSVTYSRCAPRAGWPGALALALVAWLAAASALALLPGSAFVSLGTATATLLLAPHVFPRVGAVGGRPVSALELGLRMLAGTVLTLAVTLLAAHMGARWSGLLAVFPILGIVLAVFSHRAQGAAFAAALLRAMATGLWSFVAFCFVLSAAV